MVVELDVSVVPLLLHQCACTHGHARVGTCAHTHTHELVPLQRDGQDGHGQIRTSVQARTLDTDTDAQSKMDKISEPQAATLTVCQAGGQAAHMRMQRLHASPLQQAWLEVLDKVASQPGQIQQYAHIVTFSSVLLDGMPEEWRSSWTPPGTGPL